jgi:hypothetical protein
MGKRSMVIKTHGVPKIDGANQRSNPYIAQHMLQA